MHVSMFQLLSQWKLRIHVTQIPVDLFQILLETLETAVIVHVFQACLDLLQIVIQNAKLIEIVLMTKHARTRSA